MEAPLDELYLRWLYSQVGSVKTRIRARTFWGLFRQLYSTEFVWWVPNDDNRAMDGIRLRLEFMEDHDIESVDENWLGLGCSFLEMLIALSRRLAFEGGGEPLEWFWVLIRNLEMIDYTDAQENSADEISEKVNRVIWRLYKRNGIGGLFPLRSSKQDQTEVEIWYQLNAYLLELNG